VQRLPSGGKGRAAQGHGELNRPVSVRTLPRSLPFVGAITLVLLALVAGTVLMWPRLTQREAPAAAPPRPVAVSPTGQQASPTVPVEPATVAQIPAVPVQEPTPAAVLLPTRPQPFADTTMPRSLAIIRLPSDDKAATATGTAADIASTIADATHRFQPGERIRLLVAPSRDAHVYCYLQDEARRIVRFYPNRYSKSALVTAATPLEIPGRMRFELVANTRNVTETIACFGSERDVMGELPAAVVGTDFAKLPATSLDQVRSAFARLAPDTFTEASFEVRFK
jgi:Domain of unknown function (DUF4384)